MIRNITIRSFLILLILVVFSLYLYPKTKKSQEQKLKTERMKMVEDQIKKRGIKDKRVLNALKKVKRHLFIPHSLWDEAYGDYPLPIGEGQTISQPYVVALMTELLKLKEKEKVLEIGTGSGYQAAILAELCKEVYSVEIIESLAQKSKEKLAELGYKNIFVFQGDGYLGLKKYAPFDGIIVTCAPPYVPEPLKEQLKEGGRMVIPVGDYFQELKVLTKRKGKINETSVIPVRFVPMTGDHIKKK
ncbi:MAG: protein-L-isoaspartate(D-aspartate) O-methyltransferase [Spirochaetes bacterium]|nr:protein-L-isoaspartate(D-aspartate) O-methyltransferase [Spirochaetota bacterium]